MLQAATWRFDKKKNLLDWGREERAQRINMQLTFAAKEELEDQCQDQCLDMRLIDLQKDFRDVVLMLDNKELDISSMQTKYERLAQYITRRLGN